MSGAREEVLDRIRRALADRATASPVERSYRRAGEVPLDVELFVERVEDYKATVHRCDRDDVAASVDRVLGGRGVEAVVVPDGFPDDWRPDVRIVDEPVDVDTLDAVGAVLTTCRAAVAETGTIVLDAGPGMGRRALTLVPDYHLVVVTIEQVHANVPDVVAVLDVTRPLTWISGPSATSDIELDRVEGVHGPRTLDVLLVAAPPGS